MVKDEDQLIKKMAKLLREGATMLDKSCPKCGTLIYRLPSKKIVCPNCNSEIRIQKEGPPHQTPNTTEVNSGAYEFDILLSALQVKLNFLTQKLQNEGDISQIERIITIITMNKVIKIEKLSDSTSISYS